MYVCTYAKPRPKTRRWAWPRSLRRVSQDVQQTGEGWNGESKHPGLGNPRIHYLPYRHIGTQSVGVFHTVIALSTSLVRLA
jgi:hypothetical protein